MCCTAASAWTGKSEHILDTWCAITFYRQTRHGKIPHGAGSILPRHDIVFLIRQEDLDPYVSIPWMVFWQRFPYQTNHHRHSIAWPWPSPKSTQYSCIVEVTPTPMATPTPGSWLEDGGNRQRLAFSWSASSTVRDASPHSNHFRCTISCKLEDYFCNDAWIRVSAVHTWST